MNKIEELIEKLCPDGVEFRELGEVCINTSNIKWQNHKSSNFKYIDLTSVDRRRRIITETQSINVTNAPSRAQKIIHTGDVIFGTTRPTLMRLCVIEPEYHNQICSTGFCVIRPNKDFLLTNYVFHLLGSKNFYDYVEYTQKGASYPAISDFEVKKFQIPIPPLPIQQEIVNILDSFTQLEAELEAELEARKKQYEYYRNDLLNFEGKEVEWRTMGEKVNIKRGVRVVRNQLLENGKYPVYQNSMKPLGYFEKYNYNANTTFIISAGAAGDVGFSDVDFWAADDCFLCICPDYLKSKFLYYVLLCNQTYLYSRVRRASVPRLSRDAIAKIQIPIPPISEQERIVAILDKFDALVNDISIGLPAEIQARRKQYEFYRGKLLDFKNINAVN